MKTGDKVIVYGEVTGTITALNSGEKYRVKIGNDEYWLSQNDCHIELAPSENKER